jgi:fatty acyl-CoA reductase
LRRRKNCIRVVRHTACSVVVRVPSKACASPNFPLCLVSSHLQQQWKVTLKEAKSTARALDDKHVESQTETSLREKSIIDGPLKAAFFDVDGTITRTNVVLAYFAVRMSELPLFLKLFWVPWFGLKGIFYLLIDRIDRALFNRVFYRSYNGRSTSLKDAMAALIYKKYYKPRIFNGAVELIQQLKERGYKIVFVTGALDFQIAPLALDLGADFVYAAELVEKEGRFTGKLKGMAASNTEKADRMQEYARVHGVSLADSLAFGDSIADLPMLEIAGQPHAVNPDSRLKAIATKRGWPILQWSTQPKETSQYAAAV